MKKNKRQVKVDCLNRLFELTSSRDEMIDFLQEEKIIGINEVMLIKNETDKDRMIYNTIKKACKEDLILLASFDWVLLPDEKIKIQIITTRSNKNFTYNW